MTRIAMLIEYDGKRFHGSQFQLGLRTVQSELESALSTYLRKPTQIILSGRTDQGVHAVGQVGHVDIDEDERALDLWRLNWAINGILKKDLSLRSVQVVPASFHARFEAVQREYVYRLLNRSQRSAVLKDNHYFIPRALNLSSMQEGAASLLGTHDFRGFRSTNADKSSTVCLVRRAEILNKGEGQLEFWIAADHFVYNMVRIIAGTLIEIGLGKKAPESLATALVAKDRNLAGVTAPSWGLTLHSVYYPDKYNLFQAL
jgi:tRNA pseudouridine38-40 synthase